MVVNQWVPAAHRGDAVGDSARRVRGLLRDMGHESDLYALTIDDELQHDVRPFSDPAARRGDSTIFHYALPSPMTSAFASLAGGRILQYHNVTPARFFAPYDPPLFRLASLGRQELTTLVGQTDLALGDSEYNRQELESLGFAPTGVFPIAVDTTRVTQRVRRPALEAILDDGLVNFLFVGRIAPNKKIEDHIRLAEHYKRYVDAYYRFIFVGRTDVVPQYYAMVRTLMSAYRLLHDRFIFTGPVPDEELAIYYQHAAVYVSLSEHEGFCVPLLESMAADVPILAYSAAAVPDTLGGAGVQFAPKDLEYAAELLGALAFDDDLRARVITGQRRRLADFGDARITSDLTGLPSPTVVKIAFIVQRYGAEVLGGSEHLCRLVAERLALQHEVEVLTTCARDYVTWKNDYSEGSDRIRGVTVRRFPNAHTRDIEAFNRYSAWIFSTPHSPADEMEWLKQQGPWCPPLVDYLRRHHQQYDVLIFFTYLYAPTVLGLEIAPARSVLVPTAHDEPAIRLDLFKEVFSRPAALCFLTESERRFVTAQFADRPLLEEVIGVGVELPQHQPYPRMPVPVEEETTATAETETASAPPEEEAPTREFPSHLLARGAVFLRRHRLYGPVALYGGRIDPGKGCEELIEYFSSYVKEGGDATLALMGVKLMSLPEEPFIRFAGLLSDREHLQALEAATVVVCPSPYESLSLLALEALSVGTPILANARSAVLVEHCVRSNGGLYYADRDEFVESLKLLVGDAGLRSALGRNGREYVRRNYRWDVVLAKYERIFAKVRNAR